MTNEVFAIPCKFDPDRPIILDCVASIRRHHPGALVIVVDSASENRDYIPLVKSMGTVVCQVDNTNFTIGAYGHAWRKFGFVKEARWHCIHDSVILHAPIPTKPLCVRWFSGVMHGWGWDQKNVPLEIWGEKVLAEMGLARPTSYRGILGPMWFCHTDVMMALDQLGVFDIQIPTKWENAACERVMGIVFEHFGFDVTQSLQGEHIGHFDPYDKSVVEKIYQDRM